MQKMQHALKGDKTAEAGGLAGVDPGGVRQDQGPVPGQVPDPLREGTPGQAENVIHVEDPEIRLLRLP